MAQAFEREDWPTLFATADRLLAVNPAYERDEVDRMLFEALYRSGLLLVEQDRVTEAVRMFDRALLLRPDDPEVARARELATQYVTGLSYWEGDWALAIASLERVHAQEPGYRDVAARLGEAHRRFGEQLVAAQDWCGAEEQFAQALEFVAGGDLTLAHEQAAAQCAAQSSTPTADLTPGIAEDEMPVPSGTYLGEIVGSEKIGSKKMFIRGHVLDNEGNGVGGVRVTIRAWDWSVTATSDGQGQFSFDGLANPVTYTVSLADLPSEPLDVAGAWDTLIWIRFRPGD
jgi:tetratricopeptide (TPR) repeat protein